MAFDKGRLKKELTELTRDTKSGVTARPPALPEEEAQMCCRVVMS